MLRYPETSRDTDMYGFVKWKSEGKYKYRFWINFAYFSLKTVEGSTFRNKNRHVYICSYYNVVLEYELYTALNILYHRKEASLVMIPISYLF